MIILTMFLIANLLTRHWQT